MHRFWVIFDMFHAKVIQIKLVHSFKSVKLNNPNTKVSGKIYITLILLFILGITFCLSFQNLICCCKTSTINKASFFCVLFLNNEAGKSNRTMFQIKFVFLCKCYAFVHDSFLTRPRSLVGLTAFRKNLLPLY